MKTVVVIAVIFGIKVMSAMELTKTYLQRLSREELESICLGAILIASNHPEDFDKDLRPPVVACAKMLDQMDAQLSHS